MSKPKTVEKPRVATVLPPEEGCRKLVLTVPSKFSYRDTVAFSHESLSVLRSWCVANNYKIDESRLNKPVKPKNPQFYDDSEEYTY